MADTSIEWTQSVWNPASGCDRVSDGCTNCYALTMAKRLKAMGAPGYQRDGNPATSGPGFGLTLHSDKLSDPLRWRKPRRVFVNSMSDLFHADVPVEFIAEAFAVMAVTPQHTYQILTKRHARMRAVLRSTAFQQQVQIRQRAGVRPTFGFTEAWPLPNVWLGVSVETQQWADIRVPALLDTPAAVRFLSCEPLLGPVTLKPQWLVPDALVCGGDRRDWTTADSAAMSELLRAATRRLAREDGGTKPAYVDWVIVGGESGPHARPMYPDWARALRDQCTAAGVPFFLKQWGEWAPIYQLRSDKAIPPGPTVRGEHVIQTDHGVIRMHKVGKKAAGRELDGRTWDQYPQAVTT